MLGPSVYGHGHVPGMPPVYTIAAMQPGAPHPHHHVAAAAAAAAAVAPLQQQLLAQQAEEMRKSAKRAANRRSANTCRLRKKFFVENMADANERMRKRARVLSLLPDMILAMRRDGVITYASENCRQFLQFTRQQEVEGTNIFDLVESGSHNRLRRLLEENLGSVSKEAIASALRHQGTTFESLLARAEKAKEQGDSGFFTMSGEAPRFPGPTRMGSSGSSGSGAGDMGGSTDDWESEAASLAGESQGRTTGGLSSSGSGGGGGGCGRKIKRWSTVGSSGSGGMSDSSSGGGGAGGGGGVGKGKDAGKNRRSFPPLGPPAFPVVASGERITGGGSAAAWGGGAQSGGGANGTAGGTRHAKGGGSLLSEGAKAREVGGEARKLELCSDAKSESAGGGPISGGSDGGGSGGGKASMVNVDRDLQSKINAFTNTQKDLCKLEIMRQDQKFEWYEVRSSMRLAWLKAKQMIIPVEVICSFQQMHTDCPAGSANGIVARLQRAASVARPLGAGNDGKGSGDSLSGNSSGFSGFGGFSGSGGSGGSGDSNGAGSPDLEDSVDLASPDLDDQGSSNDGRCGHPSSEDGHANEAVSSDYGAGTSSGSVSGDGNSAQSNSNGGAHRRAGGGGGVGKQPPSLHKAAAAAAGTGTGTGRARRGGGGGGGAAGGPEPEARRGGGLASGGTADWAGDGASPVSALAALAAAAAAASQAAPLTHQQQPSRRLAAKKSILFRHGADSQS
ncbi:unnamed protein product [Ectocarpus sp. 12 AP-2014]